jgi:hypothetical protein
MVRAVGEGAEAARRGSDAAQVTRVWCMAYLAFKSSVCASKERYQAATGKQHSASKTQKSNAILKV